MSHAVHSSNKLSAQPFALPLPHPHPPHPSRRCRGTPRAGGRRRAAARPWPHATTWGAGSGEGACGGGSGRRRCGGGGGRRRRGGRRRLAPGCCCGRGRRQAQARLRWTGGGACGREGQRLGLGPMQPPGGGRQHGGGVLGEANRCRCGGGGRQRRGGGSCVCGRGRRHAQARVRPAGSVGARRREGFLNWGQEGQEVVKRWPRRMDDAGRGGQMVYVLI